MIELARQKDCTGCSACSMVCPQKAIEMKRDEEGFLQPRINRAKCVSCGRCVKACSVLNRTLPRKPLSVYGAKACDERLRERSSSGGMFGLLARNIIHEGGVVIGVACIAPEGIVRHVCATTECELDALFGSKYVQSDIGESFALVRQYLVDGVKVLFSGTPCQVAGLLHYLDSYAGSEVYCVNLTCVDFVCHGVPSPWAWMKYLDKRKDVHSLNHDLDITSNRIPSITRISFRRKNCGWKRYSLSLEFSNGNEYSGVVGKDPFLRGFLGNLYLRHSCEHCPSRSFRSGADLTMADYWGVSEVNSGVDDDRGVSLVFVNTPHGRNAFDKVKSSAIVFDTTYEHALSVNESIVQDSAPHYNRKRFFNGLAKGRDFDAMVSRLLRLNLIQRISWRILRDFRRLFS